MIVYAYVMQVSVGGLFAAGFVPGLIMGGLLMVMTVFLARRRNYPKRERRAPPAELWTSFRGAFLPMLTPIIILGGILSGVFTPTEAAAAAVIYALALSLFVTRSMKLDDLPRVLLRAGLSSAAILLVIGAAVAFGWIAAVSRIPDALGHRAPLLQRQQVRPAVPHQPAPPGGRHVPRRRSRHPDPWGPSSLPR